jgi:hypothetical protein
VPYLESAPRGGDVGESRYRPRLLRLYGRRVATTPLTAARSSAGRCWLVSVTATVIATGTLEVVATTGGVLLAASRLLDGASHRVLLGWLAATYLVWGAALSRNLVANWRLLEATGTSTNALSKAAFELVRVRSGSRRATRTASAAGYILTEIAKEGPVLRRCLWGRAGQRLRRRQGRTGLPRRHEHRCSALRVHGRQARRSICRPPRATDDDGVSVRSRRRIFDRCCVAVIQHVERPNRSPGEGSATWRMG